MRPTIIIQLNPYNLFLNPKSQLFHLSRGDGTTYSPGNCEISGGKVIQDNGMVRNISSRVRLTGLKSLSIDYWGLGELFKLNEL